jgi:hypothetical protein
MPSKNPEVLARAQRNWRAKNPDYRENWRKANPEKVAEYNERSSEKRRGQWNAYYWANRDRILVNQRANRAKHPEKSAERQMKAKFGITLPEKEQLWLCQNKSCKICGVEISLLGAHIDHVPNSKPAIVRALLCVRCNTGLGSFWDCPELLEMAAEYLRTFQL